MAEEGSQIRVRRESKVLGDVTNIPAKIGFPLVPGKFLIGNDTIRKRGCVGGEVKEPDSSRKRILGELDNVSKGKGRINWTSDVCRTTVDNRNAVIFSKGSNDGCSKHLSLLKTGMMVRETGMLDCNAKPMEADIELNALHSAYRVEKNSSSLGGTHFQVGDSLVHGLAEAELKDSCTTSVSLPLRLESTRDSLLVAEKLYKGYSQESGGERSNIIQTNAAALQKCTLGLHKSPTLNNSSIEFVNLTENAPQKSEYLPNEPFNGISEQGSSEATELVGSKDANIGELDNDPSSLKQEKNDEGGLASVKACSCSFCLKAAYMWVDLLYEDSKGHLSRKTMDSSEIKRIRREARFLAGRCYTHDSIGRNVENHGNYMGLELDLMQRWRILFLHTENVLTCESARLQSNLLKLKELRESCKRDVEMIGRVQSTES